MARSMEKELNNLQREAKNYLDSMRSKCPFTISDFTKLNETTVMSASQARIAETLELFYTNDRTSDVRTPLPLLFYTNALTERHGWSRIQVGR